MGVRTLNIYSATAAALMVVAMAAAQPGDGQDTRTARMRLIADDPAGLALQLERAGFDVLEGGVTTVSVDVVVMPAELAALREMGLQPSLVSRGRPLRDILKERPPTEGSVPLGYRDLAQVIESMNATADAFPDICRMVNVTEQYSMPSTFDGHDLFALKISDNVAQDEDEPAILVVSCHHAREIITPELALYAIEQLTSLYGSDQRVTDAVDSHEIWIAPVWNPDGYDYVFTTDNNWRKNRRDGVGVDQNRNYPINWTTACSGSTTPSSQTYKGPSPGSEPETQTMIALSRDQRFAKVIDYHSSGRESLWGYACPTHPFDNFMQQEAIALSNAAGYGGSNRPPSADGEHYQWQFAIMGAHAFLVETQTQFQPSYQSALNEAALVWPGTLWMIERPIPVSGHVADAQTGDPLEALVEIQGLTFNSGEENFSGGPFGAYHLFAPAGNYELRFSAPGYDPETRQVTVTADTGLVLDVTLSPEGPSCEGDLNGSLAIEMLDLARLVSALGQTGALPEDLNGDGTVDDADRLIMAAAWGGCVIAP